MLPTDIKDKNVLVAPLNWGLGHATRSYAIIKQLNQNNNRVVLASDGEALIWLKKEFPDLRNYTLPELKIRYSVKRGAIGGVVRRLPHFINSIKRDYQVIQSIIEKEEIDLVISDNRYGVYNHNIHSILITHQLRIMHPFGKFIDLVFRNYLEKFDEIWVPDHPNRNLSGDLSKPLTPLSVPITFIGWQSRFKNTVNQNPEFNFLSIVSGPEPHKSQLNKTLSNYLKKTGLPCAMVLGNMAEQSFSTENNLSIWSNLSTTELESLINRSETIICRSGYSSIMDLVVMKKKALLIPTPGQTEQIYLAKYQHNKGQFKSIFNKQDFIDSVVEA